MNPVIVSRLGEQNLVLWETKYGLCSINENGFKNDIVPQFLGIPAHLDWNEPFDQLTMEVIVLRSLWDQIP